MAEFEVTSPAFEQGQPIPRRHTCEGEDVLPPLAWRGVPEGTGSLALVVDDSDAPGGTFSHWRAWGIAPAAGGLGEGEAPPSEGRNDFGSVGWRGPCPPPEGRPRGRGLAVERRPPPLVHRRGYLRDLPGFSVQ